MSRLCVWVDDFAAAALPKLLGELAAERAMVMRSFGRVPNPAMVGQLAEHRQVAIVGGRDFEQLVARIETATTTLPIGVVAVLPKGVEAAAALRGPGVVDVLPAGADHAARRVVLMSGVPIVSGVRPPAGRPRGPDAAFRSAPTPTDLRAVAIASSTGGCWVLAELLKGVARRDFAVLLAQHLDGEFVGFFAQWLEASCQWPARVVDAPEPIVPGTVYLPAGGQDLCVDRALHVHAAPPASRFVPSADRLFAACADVLGARAIGVVLSGMGSDGAAGLAAIARNGGRALCQAPASAIVASMPESALRSAPGATALPPPLLSAALGMA